jgi:hypothetical protein
MLIPLLVVSGATVYKGCGKDSSLVVWNSERKLTWADFKDTVKSTKHINLAVSFISLRGQYKLNGMQLVDYDIACVFVKDSSWIRDTSTRVMSHEQGHFDMGEVIARQYRKACSIASFSRTVNSKYMDSLNTLFAAKFEKSQDEYDSILKQDPYMQPVLLEQIAKDLKSLQAYERQGKGLLKL